LTNLKNPIPAFPRGKEQEKPAFFFFLYKLDKLDEIYKLDKLLTYRPAGAFFMNFTN